MVGLIVVASASGYAARRLRWCSESAAQRIMLATIVFGYPAAGMLPVWVLPIRWSDVWLPIQCVLVTFVCFGIGLVVARLHRMVARDAGVYAYAAAHSNMGFTLGGFICLRLFGEEGLGFATIYVTLWNIVMMGFFFPLAGAFAGRDVRFGVGQFLRALLDIRCLPLAGILVGLGLNVAGVPRPDWIGRWHVPEVFVMVCTAAMFFVIGLRLHFSQLREHLSACASLSVIKFGAAPLVAVALLTLAGKAGVAVGELQAKVVIVESLMPMALFAVAAANLYGLNGRLASLLFVVNTGMFLVLVLPVIVLIFG